MDWTHCSMVCDGYSLLPPCLMPKKTSSLNSCASQNVAFEVFAKRLAHIRLGGAVVALPIELACAGHLKPSLEVLGYLLVQ